MFNAMIVYYSLSCDLVTINYVVRLTHRPCHCLLGVAHTFGEMKYY